MVNYKVQVLEGGEFPTEDAYVEHYQKMFYKYTNMDERDCYIEFPLEAFQCREFIDQFDIGLPSTLRTYGLETKQMTPNFVAIKEFLEKRFNLLVDDTDENNPLIYIPKRQSSSR
ncbi:hypothetical protein, partial [Pedobacter sp. ASV12]|uniref:hypothetical protein n=1 Tax=Pedobacter sp. ASV12 TaxID=2795120 RepID=UPI001E3213E0